MPIRAMTLLEKDRYADIFPNLNVDNQPRVTGEETPDYNCIAWTVGITDDWINPKSSLQEWAEFYDGYGFEHDPEGGEIAIWKRGSTYTHGSVASDSDDFDWESKCGALLRLLHDEDELAGDGDDDYGTIFTYFRRRDEERATARINVSSPKPTAMTSRDTANLAHTFANEVEPSLREAFREQFKAWKATWFAGRMALSSDTRDRTDSYSYRALIKMGPAILPLVVEELLEPSNFVANCLYLDLQSDAKLRLRSEFAAGETAKGERARSKLIVASYVESRK
jgi:hypothetical protein